MRVSDAPIKEPWIDMTPRQRLDAAMRLWQAAWELKLAWVRQQHPDWDDAQVTRAVRDAYLFRPG